MLSVMSWIFDKFSTLSQNSRMYPLAKSVRGNIFFLNYTVRLKGLLATFVASDAVLTTSEARKNIEDCVQIVAWYHMYYYYTF